MRGSFIKADGDRLAEIHRGLLRIGGNDSEQMAMREISLREPALLRAEDQSDAAAAGELFLYDEARDQGAE